ncbi:hypothetical protein ACH46F_36770 [Streptomyces virginiae]|uniref:hypothetical protein n=1 Tax=Streptomyces virginiae TaxID=1961 RepID=UPI0037A5EAC5
MTATMVRASGERHTGQTIQMAELHQNGEAVLSADGTALQLPGLQNTVLRDVLESWDSALAPMVSMLVVSLNAAASQVPQFRLRVEQIPGGKLAWVGPGLESADEESSSDSFGFEESGDRPAVSAVNELAQILGLPVRDVLAGAGIARRTFYSWRGSDVSPRLASQGRLWSMLQASMDLREMLGHDLQRWIAADSDRRQSIVSGNLDSLIGEVLEEKARRGEFSIRSSVAEWMEAAGPEGDSDTVTPPRRLVGRVAKAKPGSRTRKDQSPGI